MRKPSIIILLTLISTAAIAAPDSRDRDPDTDDSDSLHITMTAGKGRLGVSVVQISPELRAHFGAPADRGVLVDAVKPDSPAARAGLRAGDVIVEVDGEPTTSATDVLAAMADRNKGDTVQIATLRAGQRAELRATLEDDPGAPWRGGKKFGSMDKLEPRFQKWFDDGMPSFESFRSPSSSSMRRALDDARRRIEQLERRLERLERRDSAR